MRIELFERIRALPPRSVKRQRILAMFGCYSMSTVFVRVLGSTEPERQAMEQQIAAIIDAPETAADDAG